MKKELNPADKAKAQLVIVTGLMVIGLVFGWHRLVLVAAGLGLGFVFIPPFGDLVLKIWFGIAEALGWFSSRVLLSSVYFIFLTPLAFFYRLSGNNPLKLKRFDGGSVFDERNHQYTKDDLENMW